jgi:hypothetical protein
LPAVARLGDEALYWRIFFKVGSSKQWNAALRDLLQRPLDDAGLALALGQRTPQANQWWRLDADVALALYRRQPAAMRPFLERFLDQSSADLFREAEAAGDEEFLDFLCFRMLRTLSRLAWRAFPRESALRWSKPDAGARQELETLSALVTHRFDRLFARGPEHYVRHAANILGRFNAFEIWDFDHDRRHNPALAYLVEQHHDAWLRSPASVRDLMESPNIFVQIAGLQLLSSGSRDAADRVIENLPLLRALLLGRARLQTKKLALACLERAAGHGSIYAARIMPLLEETMDFRGKRAIAERIMVSFVRVRRANDVLSRAG